MEIGSLAMIVAMSGEVKSRNKPVKKYIVVLSQTKKMIWHFRNFVYTETKCFNFLGFQMMPALVQAPRMERATPLQNVQQRVVSLLVLVLQAMVSVVHVS